MVLEKYECLENPPPLIGTIILDWSNIKADNEDYHEGDVEDSGGDRKLPEEPITVDEQLHKDGAHHAMFIPHFLHHQGRSANES